MALVNATHTATDVVSEIAVPAKSDRTHGIASVEITNIGAHDIYIGGPDISPTAGGITLAHKESWFSPSLTSDDAVYVVCDAAQTSAMNLLWIGA